MTQIVPARTPVVHSACANQSTGVRPIRTITVYCAACHLEGTGTDFRAGTGYEGARHLEEQGWRRAGHGRWKCPRCANQRSKQRHHGRGWPGR